ncbi:MAG: hypothetical protein IJK96_02945 [Bacteroidales bacterium]|nr:hypothetical protein [Bacteroidales bacterium]
MKNKSNMSFFRYAFMTLVFMGALTACVNDEVLNTDVVKKTGSERLAVSPTVSESPVKHVTTRAESIDSLQEKTLNTLDVFVEHISNGTGDGTFLRQYHLTNATEGDLNKLADRWRQEGLLDGEKYNIYVAANNPLTTEDVASVTALKALTYNEVEAGVAELDDDGNIKKNSGDATTGNIYKRYSQKITGRAYTNSKEFMMDGVIPEWTPDPTTLDQTFDVTMNRAAAKIVLNVTFDETFVNKLTEEGVTITGTPAWKFNNFAFGAPVFTPDTAPTAGEEVHNSGFNIFHNQYVDGGSAFSIVTYSYPNKWTGTTDAPSLIVSIGYKEGDNDVIYNYYRVPIVPKSTTSLDRNTIYVIDATIKTRGSDAHEDITEMSDLLYEVLPWNDESNSAAIHNDVESVQHYYFKVNPKVYTLRGDGDQDVVLTYLKAAGTKVNWKLFTYDENGNQTGVVANNASGATRAWFYNADGAFTTTYNDNESGMNWSNTGPTPMGVKIEQSTEGTSGSTGTVTVTSHALNNRAIKYIRLRVYLDEEATFKNGKETLYEDIIIRHFPTDNIQNIVGSWSSYHAAGSGTQEVTLTTTSLVEAEAWKVQYGVNYTTQELTATDYITYEEYSDHAGETGYTMTGPTASNYTIFHQMVTTRQARAAANSQANAAVDPGDGHNYYWGENPQQVATGQYYNGEWDYRNEGTYNNRIWYKYQNYYTASYTHTYTYNQYSMTVEMVTTGNWFDIADLGQTYSGNDRKINANSNFFAKVYEDGIVNAVVVNNNGNAKTYSLKHGANTDYYYYWDGSQTQSMRTSFNLTNNHMYVIQISSTSEGYIMGRPILGNPNQYLSQDDVVSPAFMIASQLGAVTPFTGNNAATNAAAHCSRYMEVATDGTRYTGWRLPTPDEISVITRYQQGTINGVTISDANYRAMTPVLTGNTYWSLTGNAVSTGMGEGGPYLRCVRDLSAEEVDRLNGFDKIIEKYQN